jgi:predicted nucleotidyltransferase
LILRDDFGSESDIEILVEFEPARIPALQTLADMELVLTGMLGRKVDLRTSQDLSVYFRDAVTCSATVQYAG